mmetsp:Transcript_357/g.530  ORF Transcript_357/g.530 Transcript_357/m.530 type:complete len:85 (-) Transcript_357:14-268(-)
MTMPIRENMGEGEGHGDARRLSTPLRLPRMRNVTSSCAHRLFLAGLSRLQDIRGALKQVQRVWLVAAAMDCQVMVAVSLRTREN